MCDCKPDRRFLIALLDYCAARVNKTHIPFQVRRSCTVHVTSVCDRHLVDIYSPYMHGGGSPPYARGGRSTTFPGVTRTVVSSSRYIAWYISEPQHPFKQLPLSADQSYPGIRTARMCNKPGCGCFVRGSSLESS